MDESRFAWVKTTSHRSRDQLIRSLGWRPVFGKPGTGFTLLSGEFFRVPAHHLDAALKIRGVTHAKTLTREQVRPYIQSRPSQRGTR
jgi:hypothetical protein